MDKIIYEQPAWWILGLFAGGSPKGLLQIQESGWLKFTLDNGLVVMQIPINRANFHRKNFDIIVTIETRSYHLQLRRPKDVNLNTKQKNNIRPVLYSRNLTNDVFDLIQKYNLPLDKINSRIIAASYHNPIIHTMKQLLILNTIKFFTNIITTIGTVAGIYAITHHLVIALLVGLVYIVVSSPIIYLSNKKVINRYNNSLTTDDLKTQEIDILSKEVTTDTDYYSRHRRQLFVKITFQIALLSIVLSALMYFVYYLFLEQV